MYLTETVFLNLQFPLRPFPGLLHCLPRLRQTSHFYKYPTFPASQNNASLFAQKRLTILQVKRWWHILTEFTQRFVLRPKLPFSCAVTPLGVNLSSSLNLRYRISVFSTVQKSVSLFWRFHHSCLWGKIMCVLIFTWSIVSPWAGYYTAVWIGSKY